MNRRNTVIAAFLSVISVGQPLAIGTAAVLISTTVLFSVPETAQAESAGFYVNRGITKYSAGDYSGALSDYRKAIEINPNLLQAYTNRGLTKEKIGDMKGACFDWRRASSLGDEKSAKWVRNQCE